MLCVITRITRTEALDFGGSLNSRVRGHGESSSVLPVTAVVAMSGCHARLPKVGLRCWGK